MTADLAGRLPTLDEWNTFAASTDPLKRDQAIDRLLASADFGTHWGLDILAGWLVATWQLSLGTAEHVCDLLLGKPIPDAFRLDRTPDPSAQWVYLNALPDRTAVAGRPTWWRSPTMGVDAAPPLPEEQVKSVLASYDRLRRQKPQWLTSSVLLNVLTELKRARRPKDEERVYKQAVEAQINSFLDAVRKGSASPSSVQEALTVMHLVDAIYRSAETGREVKLG